MSWYLVRVTVRQRRCSALGTKLKVSSSDTSRLIKRSQSAKSFFRPRRPRFDNACARCRVPRLRPCSFPFLTDRLPVPLQRAPNRFPVLSGGFHHHFLDLLFEEPFRQRS